MNRIYYKLIQAVRTGGIVYALQKVRFYVKRSIQREKKFDWEDYAFDEFSESKSEPQSTTHLYDVSVVVPAYNGGVQFKSLLDLIRKQKNCGMVEIVIVDSGSTDGTVELCMEYGVTLVQIPNEQFSHSYARNLGAETANGDILVFMTQDALPSSEDWLSEMIAPILKNEADAVSCSEKCPEGTDLFYRILNFGHASFVGILHDDVIGCKENCKNRMSLRRQASLSDVACAVRRGVFLKFRHRYNFAEDLDLGIRLLACGYRIKLLSKTTVVHGHNRDADYYLKRALVEQGTFSKIFTTENKKEKPEMIASRIYYSTSVVLEYLARIKETGTERKDTVATFVRCASEVFDEIAVKKIAPPDFDVVGFYKVPLLEEVVDLCKKHHKLKRHSSNTDLAYSVRFYLDNVTEYMDYYGITKMEGLEDEICRCMLKQFALCVGKEAAQLINEEKWNQKILEWIKGV